MTTIDKHDYAVAVRAAILRYLAQMPDNLFCIQADVGYDIAASEEQVRYAMRVLRMDGAIRYDKKVGKYHITHYDPHKGAE